MDSDRLSVWVWVRIILDCQTNLYLSLIRSVSRKCWRSGCLLFWDEQWVWVRKPLITKLGLSVWKTGHCHIHSHVYYKNNGEMIFCDENYIWQENSRHDVQMPIIESTETCHGWAVVVAKDDTTTTRTTPTTTTTTTTMTMNTFFLFSVRIGPNFCLPCHPLHWMTCRKMCRRFQTCKPTSNVEMKGKTKCRKQKKGKHGGG